MRNGARVARALGDLLWLFSGVLLVPVPVAFIYDAWDVSLLGLAIPRMALVFIASALLVGAAGQAARMATHRRRDEDVAETSAYVAVAAGWLLLTVAGAIPLLAVLGPLDAWFESMSGLTATGATVIAELEATAPSILFYRSLLQLVAGFGIVVVSLALISRLTHGGAHLLASDEGVSSTHLRANLEDAARTIWRIYAGLAAMAAVGYLLAMRFHAGLGWKAAAFDAIVHAGSTISTGGFSSRDTSIAYYGSWAVEAVAVVFMLAAGTSFVLMFQAQRRPLRLLRDPEWRFYMIIILVGGLVASGLLTLAGTAAWDALRAGLFTVVSIGTSTGLVTVDHDSWPTLARSLLLVAMFTGAMAGSASGGLKILRLILLLKIVRRELRKLLHPRAVMSVRHHGRSLHEQTLLTVIAFFFAYISIWMVAAMALTFLEPQLGIFEGAAAAAAAIGNTGPAMGIVGPFDDHGGLHPATKAILGLLMWVGRLEVFSAILLLSPSSWRS